MTINESVERYFRDMKPYLNGTPILNGKASGWVSVDGSKSVYFTCRLVDGRPTDIKTHPNKKNPKIRSTGVMIG